MGLSSPVIKPFIPERGELEMQKLEANFFQLFDLTRIRILQRSDKCYTKPNIIIPNLVNCANKSIVSQILLCGTDSCCPHWIYYECSQLIIKNNNYAWLSWHKRRDRLSQLHYWSCNDFYHNRYRCYILYHITDFCSRFNRSALGNSFPSRAVTRSNIIIFLVSPVCITCHSKWYKMRGKVQINTHSYNTLIQNDSSKLSTLYKGLNLDL